MSFFSWLRNRPSTHSPRPRTQRRPATPRFRPTLEVLEDRCLPSTLMVTSAADSGAGTLRAEIAAAKSGDTIIFAPSLDGQAIMLTSGELYIKKSLTIEGPGAGQLAISGDNLSRVFEVAAKQTIALSGLTISNGVAGSGGGGGILNDGTLTVSNSTLSGNSATQGGGIYNAGTLTVTGSVMSDNRAQEGGGIFNIGTLTITGSKLSGNSAGDGGGGILNDGTLTVSGCTVSNNWAVNGGGIYNTGTATVSGGSTLSGNQAYQYGGGIFNTGTYLWVSGCTLSDNYAALEGGGIYNARTLTNGASPLTVSNSVFTGNYPDNIYGPYYDGGGNTFGPPGL